MYVCIYIQGYILTCGLQFGGDYLLYHGDPNLYHSWAIVIIDSHSHTDAGSNNGREGLENCRIKGLDILTHGRVAHSVNKTLIIASEVISSSSLLSSASASSLSILNNPNNPPVTSHLASHSSSKHHLHNSNHTNSPDNPDNSGDAHDSKHEHEQSVSDLSYYTIQWEQFLSLETRLAPNPTLNPTTTSSSLSSLSHKQLNVTIPKVTNPLSDPDTVSTQEHAISPDNPDTPNSPGGIGECWIIILVGVPGSGKSTLCELLKQQGWVIACQDELGSVSAVRATLTRVSERVTGKRCMVLDRCNVSRKGRKAWLRFISNKLKNSNPQQVLCVWLDTPLDTCISRVRLRTQHPTLPGLGIDMDAKSDSVVRTFHESLHGAAGVNIPTKQEGYRQVWRVTSSEQYVQVLTEIQALTD